MLLFARIENVLVSRKCCSQMVLENSVEKQVLLFTQSILGAGLNGHEHWKQLTVILECLAVLYIFTESDQTLLNWNSEWILSFPLKTITRFATNYQSWSIILKSNTILPDLLKALGFSISCSKIVIEGLRGYRYKLVLFTVSIAGPI